MIQNINTWLDDAEARADAAGAKFEDVLSDSGVSHTTVWRWRNGGGTQSKTVERIESALVRLEKLAVGGGESVPQSVAEAGEVSHG